MNDSFSPLNDFESKLIQAQRGEVPVSEFMASLVSADLALPSASEVQQDWSGFQPLLFSKDGVPMLACFSAKERLTAYADMTPYCLLVKGGQLLRRMPQGHGLVINPGQSIGFDISPEGIAKIVADFPT
jgi:hypothetical protein